MLIKYKRLSENTRGFRIIYNILVCSVKPVLQYRQNRLYSAINTDAALLILCVYSSYCILASVWL